MKRTLCLILLVCQILAGTPVTARAQEKAFDYLIRNALVFDGVDSSPRYADVGINHDRIAAIGQLSGQDAVEVVDATGLYLLPGFIDVHTHSDFNPFVYPELPNKILQGVTTEITGNCGMSAAPVAGRFGAKIRGVWAGEGVKIPEQIAWGSFEQYRESFERLPLMTNLAGLIGHGNLRGAVLGFDNKEADAGALNEMKQLLDRAMRDGALGVSFGLIYLPGIFANEKEITEICRVAAEHGGVCAFHMQNEGSRLVEAVNQVIRVGKATGGRMEISHLKAGGGNKAALIQEAFDAIEQARREGVRIHADMYPYEAGFAELGVALPDDIYQREDRLSLLEDPSRRPELIAELRRYYQDRGTDWEEVRLGPVSAKEDQQYQGWSIAAIARKEEKLAEEVLVDLLRRSRFQISAFYFSQDPAIVSRVMNKPYMFIGSDSVADGSDFPHPRVYGTFGRVLARTLAAGDEKKLSSLVRRITAEAADYFGLQWRGSIRTGYFADLVLVDPARLKDRADYTHPTESPEGIEWVFVNGKLVVSRGRYTGTRNGYYELRYRG